MDSDHALVLFLGLALVGAAVVLAYSSPAAFGGESDGIGGASLASFETTEPYCGDPNSTSGPTLSQDISGGEALVLNRSIPVPSNDTTVSGSLEEIGPQRYVLAITRETPVETSTETPTPDTETSTATPVADTETPAANETATNESATDATEGNETANGTARANGTATEQTTADEETATPTETATPADAGSVCHPEVRYNATIHIAQPDEYTVVVTYDGEFVAAHWHEGNDGGSYETMPEQPETEGERDESVADADHLRRATVGDGP